MNPFSFRSLQPGRFVFALLMVCGLALGPAGPVFSARGASPDPDDGYYTYTRDIFVIVGSTLRNPTESTPPGAPLFNVAGVALDRTWGDWQAATATSRARVSGGPHRPRT